MAKRIRRSKPERRSIVEKWRRSGKSQTAFCREAGLRPASLSRWAQQFKDDKASFVEVVAETKKVARPFIITLPSNIQIEVPTHFNSSELGRLIKALSC